MPDSPIEVALRCFVAGALLLCAALQLNLLCAWSKYWRKSGHQLAHESYAEAMWRQRSEEECDAAEGSLKPSKALWQSLKVPNSLTQTGAVNGLPHPKCHMEQLVSEASGLCSWTMNPQSLPSCPCKAYEQKTGRKGEGSQRIRGIMLSNVRLVAICQPWVGP